MNIQIIQVPYDSGHESVRTGKGPDHFIQNGIEQILQKSGMLSMLHESNQGFPGQLNIKPQEMC